MPDAPTLLRAYDDQLRGDPEVARAKALTRHGPLALATFDGGRGFVTYRDLEGADVRELVAAAVDHFAGDAEVAEVEWKTRGHDRAPGLEEALAEHGFAAEDVESIMIGDAEGLAVDVALPADVTLRSVRSAADVRASCVMQDEVFGTELAGPMAAAALQRMAVDPGFEVWVAESDGRVVAAGRLDPVAGTAFAGIWGGATLPAWRGHGLYRALTAARARSALDQGKRLLHSDSTEFSRPIQERSGMVRVSTTTPWVRRG